MQSLYPSTKDDGWLDLAVEDRKTSPADIAAFRLDFKAWRSKQNKRDRKAMDWLVAGERPLDVADRLGISPARVTQLRHKWEASWAKFQAVA